MSRICNFLGAVILSSYTAHLATHQVRYEDEHVDIVALITLTCGLLSAFASYVELRQENPESEEAGLRRRLLWCADLPLVVGTLAVFSIRFWAYGDVAKGYYEWFNLNVWNGVSYSNWSATGDSIRNVHLAMRINFWNGFATGAVAIQLIAFQIVGTALRLERRSGRPA